MKKNQSYFCFRGKKVNHKFVFVAFSSPKSRLLFIRLSIFEYGYTCDKKMKNEVVFTFYVCLLYLTYVRHILMLTYSANESVINNKKLSAKPQPS